MSTAEADRMFLRTIADRDLQRAKHWRDVSLRTTAPASRRIARQMMSACAHRFRSYLKRSQGGLTA